MSESEVDLLLSKTSTLAQGSCQLRFERKGSIASWSGPNTVEYESDLNALVKAPDRLSVVDEISWCGGAQQVAVYGCADQPGLGAVVDLGLTPLAQRAVLVLHERGHNHGSPHRNASNAVMHGTLNPGGTALNSQECLRLQNKLNAAAGGGPAAASSALELAGQARIAGVPYLLARSFDPAETPALLMALADVGRVADHARIVGLLGAMGSPAAVDPMVALLRAPGAGALSREAYGARAAVPVALAWHAARTGDAHALAVLAETAIPEPPAGAQDDWFAPFDRNAAERRRRLAYRSMLALGLTGRAEALARLEALPERAPGAREFFLRPRTAAVMAAARRLHARVAARGIQSLYR